MDIIVSGIGGQGTVLASRVLGEAAIESGYEVRTSEIIGMSQREGAVVSQVRIGENLDGPLIPDNAADYYIGFELAEAVRNINKMSEHAMALVNVQKIVPPSVYLGLSSYDERAFINYLKERCPGVILINAQDMAREAGNIKTASAVMLGAFSVLCPQLEQKIILDELLGKLPSRLRGINTRAFDLGRTYMEG